MLEQRYGAGFSEQLDAMFRDSGLPHAQTLDKVPNSRRALMLAELARDRGALDALHPRLFGAYWARGLDIGDEHVLIEAATASGLEAEEAARALRDERYLGRVQSETRHAIELGVTGVPAWVIDQRALVPGAQPHEVFEQVLVRLGHDPRDETSEGQA